MDFLKVMISMKLHYEEVVKSINQISSNKTVLEHELMSNLGWHIIIFKLKVKEYARHIR